MAEVTQVTEEKVAALARSRQSASGWPVAPKDRMVHKGGGLASLPLANQFACHPNGVGLADRNLMGPARRACSHLSSIFYHLPFNSHTAGHRKWHCPSGPKGLFSFPSG